MKKVALQLLIWILIAAPLTAFGVRVYSRFRLGAHHPFKGGYVWADQPSATLNTSYQPDTRWNYNFSGAQNSVVRTATGQYQITFPHLGNRPGAGAHTGGNVQITAYGPPPTTCNATGWETFVTAPDATVSVVCFNTTNGNPVDAYFSALLIF